QGSGQSNSNGAGNSPNTRQMPDDEVPGSTQNNEDDDSGSNTETSDSTSTSANAPDRGNAPYVTNTGIDPLIATQTQTGLSYQVIPRAKVYYPPVQRNNASVTYYSAVASLAEVSVDRGSGKIELLNHHTVVECGN